MSNTITHILYPEEVKRPRNWICRILHVVRWFFGVPDPWDAIDVHQTDLMYLSQSLALCDGAIQELRGRTQMLLQRNLELTAIMKAHGLETGKDLEPFATDLNLV